MSRVEEAELSPGEIKRLLVETAEPLQGIRSGYEALTAATGSGSPYERGTYAQALLELMSTAGKVEMSSVLGIEFLLMQGVFPPSPGWSTRLQIQTMPDPKGKRVLDMGTGSGAVAVFASMRGAVEVQAADICTTAVRCTSTNFVKHQVNGKVFLSNLFDQVLGCFDIIHYNAPCFGFAPSSDQERAVTDADYQNLDRFLKEARTRLSPMGKLSLQFSSEGDVARLRGLLDHYRYEIVDFYAYGEAIVAYQFVLMPR